MKESTYQPLPRRFRPRSFLEVTGHEAVITTLKKALLRNETAHAYLFAGSRGTGKTTLARLFAKALNCSNLTEDQEPCNECSSCVKIDQGRSLNILEIDGASNRGIDDIRQINESVGYASEGRFKIYIIDEVHMLTKEAFNALLKTLEEPPAQVKFFFATTEPHKILPTILSRCQRFDLKRLPINSIEKRLEYLTDKLNKKIDSEALKAIASLSEGGLRDAESMLDQLFALSDESISLENVEMLFGKISKKVLFEFDRAIEKGDDAFVFPFAQNLFSLGMEYGAIIESFLEHYRNILLCHLDQPSQLLEEHNAQDVEAYRYSAKIISHNQCLRLLKLLSTALSQIQKTPYKRIHLEMLLLDLVQIKREVSIDTISFKLHQIQQSLNETSPVENKKISTPQPLKEITPPTPLKSTTLPSKPSLPPQEKPVVENKIKTDENLPNQLTKKEIAKHETIMRFAAVELEGVVKKN